jgi:RNA polymerase sigma factor (sigma-70 family)
MAADLKGQAAPLHPEDLALAQACARGDTDAWDRFVVEYRPILYRAADAIDPTGTARELADALYAELFGLKEQGGERQSLFRYFHGRSSLATWLRAVLSQRYVDRIRATRRLEELPDEETAGFPVPGSRFPVPDQAAPDAARFAAAMRDALRVTIAALDPRDRLRLGCYYAQEMTLVQIGKLTRESEATVSRQLARTRRGIKDEVERRLREQHRFGDQEVAECLAAVVEDAGELDLGALLGSRKKPVVDRSKDRNREAGAGSRETGTNKAGSPLPVPGSRREDQL